MIEGWERGRAEIIEEGEKKRKEEKKKKREKETRRNEYQFNNIVKVQAHSCTSLRMDSVPLNK